MATKKVFGNLSDIIGNITGNTGKLVSDIVNSAASGVAAGKSPQQVAKDIQSGGSTSYTPSYRPSYGGEYTQQQEEKVEMPTDIGALPTYDSAYMSKLNALASQVASMNYDDWTKGSQYQSLADRYGQNGRLSMQDVLGQIASRTGGLASSYATTAAQQQYNQYMAQLEEVARQMYSSERSDLMDTANLYRNLANDEYERYRDSLSDYNAQLAAAQSAARSSGSSSGSSGNNYSFVSATGPKIGRESASGTGSTSFSNIKRTISGKLAGGDVAGASRLVESVWNDLSSKQKQDIKKMGFSVN